MNFLKSNQSETDSQAQRIEELEKELDYVKALLLTMANSAYNALIVLDDDCRIIAINDRAEALFKRTRPVGETLLEVTGSDELTAMVTNAIENHEEVLEEQIRHGEKVYRVRTQVIDRNGHSFICLAMEDITELVRLNRARRDMVANISHELRTPIANIRLIIDGLFLETEKPKRKKSINSLHDIARETDALLWMAEELLDLSMIESGQAIIRMVDTPARVIVEEAIERMVDQSDAKEIEVVFDVADDLYVLCDQDKVRRVLINLIHNAIKWSPPGESIAVQAEQDGEEVVFGVLDNGPGVPEEQTARIFERFYQADESRSVSEGTGLGLAICKHIIEAHDGRIWAESNTAQSGGRFFFTLPLGEKPEES